jgi:hypothetical protein
MAAPTTKEVFGGDCRAVRNPTEPVLTAWEPDDRAQLNALRRQGAVAVRYRAVGCNVELEVLPNCIGTGEYAFVPTPSSKQDYITDERALFAELPLGGAGLSSRLRGNNVLRTDYTLTGVASLPSGNAYAVSDLRGPDCGRATHIVARIYVGGFAMASGQEQSLRAAASIFNVGAGASVDARVERVFQDGTPSACSEAIDAGRDDARCSVPLRIGLLALKPEEKVAASKKECARGTHFETGTGCVPDKVAEAPPPVPLVAAPASPSATPQTAPAPRRSDSEYEAVGLRANAAVAAWKPFLGATPENTKARLEVIAACDALYFAAVQRETGARDAIGAAYNAAAARHAGGAPDAPDWWRITVRAFRDWATASKRSGSDPNPRTSPPARWAAEANYVLIDADIVRNFEQSSQHLRYSGSPSGILAQFDRDGVEAKKWFDALQSSMDEFVSPEWTTAAITRQGTLYDAIRTALQSAPGFDGSAEWRRKRNEAIAKADRIMIGRYATAYYISQRYQTSVTSVARAVRRLSYFSDVLGNARMRDYTKTVQHFTYVDDMFKKP